MNNRRKLVIALGAGALAAPLALFAQQQGKVWRIGILAGASRPSSLEGSVFGNFQRGMRELGYLEGQNYVVEWRFAEGRFELFPSFAAELVRLNVDVIVAGTPPAVLAVKQVTTTIPIVMVISYDPVASGLVASLARPGGNITGLSATSDVNVKHLDLLKTMIPKLSRVAVLVNTGNPSHSAVVKAVQTVGAKHGIKILPVSVSTPEEIERAFPIMVRERTDAFIVVTDALFLIQRQRIGELAVKHRLPWIVAQREYVEAGGLLSYGQPLAEHWRRTATYVDKILKGAKPADLPVEQPTKFELVINRKTAKALGLTIPQSLLVSADEVID